jgi:small conductance mechanosensitive channel
MSGFINSLLPIILRIGLIVVITSIVQKLASKTIKKTIDFALAKRRGEGKVGYEKRKDTISHVVVATVAAIIWAVSFVIILSELGINIGPIIAGAGVAGLALGFGAQKLVQDVINGTFILMENQYSRGDVVAIGEVGANQIAGVVEDVNLRRTVLRDLDGVVHYIPNGEIVRASNMTQEYSKINLNIKVAHATDIEKAINILNQIGNDLSKDKEWGEFTKEAPSVMRVDNIDETGIDLKIVGETEPMKQWDLMGQLRLRIKKAFDKEGIEIPYPHRVIVHSKEQS